jgi:type IV pilus assembly protein PilV
MRIATRGISLIEVLVAMTIFSFGILGLLGVHARALTNFSDAKYRTDAALLTDSLLNDIWVNRANMSSYAYSGGSASSAVQGWLSEVRATLPGGNATVTVASSTVQVTVTWQPPAAAAAGQTHTHTEIATIQNP